MIKPKLYLLASTLVFLAWVPHAGAGGRGSLPAPVIESVELDAVKHQLTLTGNFFGANAPLITLGKYRLAVSESTPTQVVAKLPINLPPATYRLLVNSSSSSAEATSLYLQIPQKADTVQVALGSALPLK